MNTSCNDNTENSNEEFNIDDETIRALLPGYIQRRRLEAYKLNRLLSECAYDDIRIIGHNLKGSGGLYGLPKVGVIGSQIENLALNKNHAHLAEQITQLETYLVSLEGIFDTENE